MNRFFHSKENTDELSSPNWIDVRGESASSEAKNMIFRADRIKEVFGLLVNSYTVMHSDDYEVMSGSVEDEGEKGWERRGEH